VSYEISRQAVQARVNLWAQESAVHFCRLAKEGAEFTNVTYPTGLRTVVAEARGEKAEVKLGVAKRLRACGYMII
jgi:hypothetical protein